MKKYPTRYKKRLPRMLEAEARLAAAQIERRGEVRARADAQGVAEERQQVRRYLRMGTHQRQVAAAGVGDVVDTLVST